MMNLQRLSREGEGLVTSQLASGATQFIAPDQYAPFVEKIEREISLAQLDEAVDLLIRKYKPFDAKMDVKAAELIHRSLELTRREASDEGIWGYLAAIRRPDFVRHRWENNSWATMRTRFLRLGTRPDSNAFARLWWIAELSCRDGDYTLTQRLLRRQPLATSIFVRSYAFYPEAVEACVEVLEKASAPIIERVSKEFYRTLSTLPLEGLSVAELIVLLRRLQKG
jgi:hypothetical protein